MLVFYPLILLNHGGRKRTCDEGLNDELWYPVVHLGSTTELLHQGSESWIHPLPLMLSGSA